LIKSSNFNCFWTQTSYLQDSNWSGIASIIFIEKIYLKIMLSKNLYVWEGLRELLICLCDIMKSDIKNTALLTQVSRSIANFAAFPQNTDKLVWYWTSLANKLFTFIQFLIAPLVSSKSSHYKIGICLMLLPLACSIKEKEQRLVGSEST
jgi:hypothetical protein